MSNVSYNFMQGGTITLYIDGQPHVVSPSHRNYEDIREAIDSNELDNLEELVNMTKRLQDYIGTDFSIKHGVFYYRGKAIDNSLGRRIVQMFDEGMPIKPMVNFFKNLQSNPSYRAVQELYSFLECNSLPITPDGKFIAYKWVRTDYTDTYTGTMDNRPGEMVSMDRNDVDDDPGNTCSRGLHFASRNYGRFGERLMMIKVDPADVVSIPYHYNNSKGRCCRYEVLGELRDGEDGFERLESSAVYMDGDGEEQSQETQEFGHTGREDGTFDSGTPRHW